MKSGVLDLRDCDPKDLDTYPKEFAVSGEVWIPDHLVFNMKDDQSIKGLVVCDGDFEFKDDVNLILPERVKFTGRLSIKDCELIKPLKYLGVEGNLGIYRCDFENYISEEIFVEGDFYIRECDNLTSISKDITVKSDFKIDCKNIKKISDKLEVNRDLYIEDCYKLESFPEKFDVNYFASLSGCSNITSLPVLEFGDLDLTNSQLKELPEGLKCSSLNIEDTHFKKLPNNLKVTGLLNIRNSDISEIPITIHVEDIDIRGCSNIHYIDDETKIKGDIIVDDGTGFCRDFENQEPWYDEDDEEQENPMYEDWGLWLDGAVGRLSKQVKYK